MDVNENLISVITTRPISKSTSDSSTCCGTIETRPDYDSYDYYIYYNPIGYIVHTGISFLIFLEIILLISAVVLSLIGYIIFLYIKKTYKCPNCGKTFKYNGMKPKICPECGKPFSPEQCH